MGHILATSPSPKPVAGIISWYLFNRIVLLQYRVNKLHRDTYRYSLHRLMKPANVLETN